MGGFYKAKATINFKTGHFGKIDSTVIISSLCKAVQNSEMTAESMLSKRPVLRFTAVLFFLHKLFSSHIYCICKTSFIIVLVPS